MVVDRSMAGCGQSTVAVTGVGASRASREQSQGGMDVTSKHADLLFSCRVSGGSQPPGLDLNNLLL